MDLINIAIAKKLAGGGGSSLPEVTSADEGKVLTVNASGEWVAERQGLFHFTNTGIDATYNQLKSHLEVGIVPYIINYSTVDEIENFLVETLSRMDNEDGYIAVFTYHYLDEGGWKNGSDVLWAEDADDYMEFT